MVQPNESEFVLYHWTGQTASDMFFALKRQAAFQGVGRDAVLLPRHSFGISRSPQTGGSVVEAYPHGLACADQTSSMNGFAAFAAFLILPLMIVQLHAVYLEGLSLGLLTMLICATVMPFTAAIAWFLLRWDITGYHNVPVLFDRAAGKVHVFHDQTKLFALLPLWGGGKFEIQTFDWSCVRAQVTRTRVVTGKVSQELAALTCVVIKAPDNAEVAAEFGVGSTVSSLAVQLLLDRWEHIRRFMEHEGPLFVEGDGPYVPAGTQSLLGALCWGQPLIGPGRQPFSWGMLLAQIFTGAFVWFTVPFGLVSYITSHIKGKPKWPAEILASVGGKPLKGQDLEAWRGMVPNKSRS